MCFGIPDHDPVQRTKTLFCAKSTWSSWFGHTCNWILELSFSLGSWSWSLISNGLRQKVPVIFLKTHACVYAFARPALVPASFLFTVRAPAPPRVKPWRALRYCQAAYCDSDKGVRPVLRTKRVFWRPPD